MSIPSETNKTSFFFSGKALGFTLVAGAIVGFILSIRVHTTPSLAFEPEICDHRAEPVIDGAPIRCISKLVNNTNTDFILSDISKGCGCLSVLSNGKELSFPLRLAPKTAIPIEVTMATESRVGFQDYVISAEGHWERSGEKTSASLSMMGAVLPSIRATPGMLYATCSPNGTASAEFILEDGFPGAGVIVKRITATNPARFVIENGPVPAADSAKPDALYKKRQFVRVRYKPADGVTIFDETITVHPKEPNVKPLLVPFQGKVLPAFTFSPAYLMIDRQFDSAFVREIEYRFMDPAMNKVQVLHSPPGLEIVIGPANTDRRLLTFKSGKDSLTEVAATKVVLKIGEGSSSASSRLEIGVAGSLASWETFGYKEVSHEQEVHRSSVRGRVWYLPGDRQEAEGLLTEGSSRADSA